MAGMTFENEVLERLARIETHLGSLIGNGQPGRISHLEKKVRRHDRLLWVATGGALAIGYVVREVLQHIR